MNTTTQNKIVVKPNKVLVTGAGLLGVAAIEKFLSAGWDVVGVSLRKPQLPSGRGHVVSVGRSRGRERGPRAFRAADWHHSHRLHSYTREARAGRWLVKQGPD